MTNYCTKIDQTLNNLTVRNNLKVKNLTITDGSSGNITLLEGATPVNSVTSFRGTFQTHPTESPIYSAAANTGAPTKADGLLSPDGIRLKPLIATPSCPGTYAGLVLPAAAARYGPVGAASLVQSGPCLFVSGTLDTTGSTLTQVAFKGDANDSASVWKLKINAGGAWQSPFHTHGAEEKWVCTAGSWVFRYYDPALFKRGGSYLKTLRPGEAPGANTGPLINFSDRGFPSGPNTQITINKGDVFISKRGTFFEWGSDVAGSIVVASWFASFMSGGINWISTALGELLAANITECQFFRYLGTFSEERLTPFVACPL